MTIIVLFSVDLYSGVDFNRYVKNAKVFLVEDEIYFNRNKKSLGSMHFNILKPIYHRATMMSYFDKLVKRGIDCTYIELKQNWTDIVKSSIKLSSSLQFFNPVDTLIETKIKTNFKQYEFLDTPRFILTADDLLEYNGPLKQTSFYSWVRKKKKILLDKKENFYGNRLTYDTENRKRPYATIEDDISDNLGSKVDFTKNAYVKEGFEYVKNNIKMSDLTIFTSLDELKIKFPIDAKGAKQRLNFFIRHRLESFGDYQDVFLNAVSSKEEKSFIFHSGLSPMLNIGLITPYDVIDLTLKHFNSLSSQKKEIHNVEGFIRQILGWREFARYIYVFHHAERHNNYFNANNQLTNAWYTGSTNILPVDVCIKKAFKYGYLHHIERLMIIANFMTLSGINPKYMYKWFMEFSLDSYNWVMVFNIYSMGSYADGGKFTSKPYISGSNYLLKISNYKIGAWSYEWDLLFWQFILKHKDKMARIGRLSLLINKAKSRVDELLRLKL